MPHTDPASLIYTIAHIEKQFQNMANRHPDYE